jgi:hypothetical protein
VNYLTRIAALLALGLTGVAVAQSPPPTRIRGEIISLSGDTLTVHRRSGDNVSITLAPAAPISAVRKLQLADIKPGSFIGTAAKTDVNGNLVAQEVVVFPESARGTGEGHYAWDLGAQSTMTNANVDAVVQGTSGNNLHLSYKGGNNTVTVPPNVPVVTFVPAARDDLVAGKKVFVIATGASDKMGKMSADHSAGDFTAQRVVVEKGGVVPPM